MKKQKELDARREAMRKHMIEESMKQQLKTAQDKQNQDNHRSNAFGEAALNHGSECSSNVISTVGLAMLKELQHQDREEDSHTLFSLSLVPRLRALPAALSRGLTVKIMCLLNDAEDVAETIALKV